MKIVIIVETKYYYYNEKMLFSIQNCPMALIMKFDLCVLLHISVTDSSESRLSDHLFNSFLF